MSYRSELNEVINTVPTYIEFRTFTEGLPAGFMIEQDGKKFSPRYHVDYYGTYDHICGYVYFYNNRSTVTFSTYEEAEQFINGFIALFEWVGAIASTSQVEDPFVAQYSELTGKVVYYTDLTDNSERIARLVKVSSDGVILEDVLPPTNPQWYSWDEVCKFWLAPQEGWE